MNGSVLFEGSPLLSGSLNVNTGGNIEPLNVEINENGTRTITPPSGVDGYAPITIDTNVPIPKPVLDTLNVTSNGTYTPPSGVDGYDEVNVNVPQPTPVLDDITITENGTYTPPTGVDGYDEVNVSVSLPENAYLLEEYEDVPTDIASFEASDAPLKSLTASIVPVQSGSGDPSPENVRPITGWTEEVITVADDTTTPTVEQTYTIPFTDSQGNPVEVYGGSVDVVNGGENPSILKKIDLGGLSWVYVASLNGFRASKTDYKKFSSAVPNGCCEIYKMVSNSNFLTNNPNNAISFGVVGGYDNNILIRDTRYTDATEFKTAVTGKYLCYELATPTTFYTQPTSIKSLDGENNVFASTGDVEELKYFTRATS